MTVLAASTLLLMACDDGDDEGADPTSDTSTDAPTGAVPMVLDYSTTYSDIGALLYLVDHPEVDLRAVTLPATGEASCTDGTRITRSILASIDRADVQVGCGTLVPDGANDWPQEWRDAANSLPGVLLRHVEPAEPIDAVDVLADVLESSAQPVTIVAVGPLTNVAELLERNESYADDIARIVIMGGAVRVDGNVEDAPASEWNLYADPASAAAVVDSGIDIVLVPLDATNRVGWDSTLAARLELLESDTGKVEAQMVHARPPFEGLYLWDETAAVVAVNPEVATLQDMAITVDGDGATAEDVGGTTVRVAVDADRDAVVAEWLRGLNSGVALTFEPLSAQDATYFDAVAAARVDFESVLEGVFTAEDEPTPVEVVDALWSGIASFGDALAAIEPPASLADEHQRLVDAMAALSAIEPQVREAAESSDPADTFAAIDAAFVESGAETLIEDFNEACAVIDGESLRRGGPDVCGSLSND